MAAKGLVLNTGPYYSKWATAAFSTALWPPLFAIINMVIDYAFDPAQIVSFGALSTAQNKYDTIATVANTMTSVIPFLAFWITRMGEGGMLHMASPIMSAMSGAASGAASEVASNSRSMNNTQIGSESMNNTSSNHHNSNFESVSGESSHNLSDGTMMKTTGNNEQVITTGDGVNQSKFASPITMRDDMQEVNATAYNKESANHKSISTSLDKGMSHQEQNVDNYVKALAKHVDTGGKVNWSSLGKGSEGLLKAVNHELQTGGGYRNETHEAATARIEASFGGKIPMTDIGANALGSLEVGGISTQDTSLINQSAELEHWSKNFENVVEASLNKDFGQSWNADSNLTQDIQSTRSKNIDLRNQEQLSSDKVESLQQRAEDIKSFGSSYDVAATHLVVDKLVDNGMTQLDAHRLIDNPVRANTEDRYMLNQARTAVRSELMYKISPLNSNGDKVVNFAESSQDHAFRMKSLEHKAQDQIQTSGKRSTAKVKQIAGGDGVSKEIVEDKLDAGKVAANRKFNEIHAANERKIAAAAAANKAALEAAQIKAEAAQPMEKAKNVGNYMVNLLKPPKDR